MAKGRARPREFDREYLQRSTAAIARYSRIDGKIDQRPLRELLDIRNYDRFEERREERE